MGSSSSSSWKQCFGLVLRFSIFIPEVSSRVGGEGVGDLDREVLVSQGAQDHLRWLPSNHLQGVQACQVQHVMDVSSQE